MRRKLVLMLGGVILFIFIMITSFAWSKIFYKDDMKQGDIAVLNIQFSEENGVIDTTQYYPSKDAYSDIEPYSFQISNTSRHDSHYRLLLEEDPISNVVGYRQEDLLTTDQLSYELSLNGSVIKKAKLSTLKKNVLDDRIIQGNKENNYTLKIWVNDSVNVGEWENKYFHYQVKPEVIE